MGKKHLISFRIDEIQNEELETLFKFTIKPRADFLRELLFLGLKSYREDMGKVRRKHEFDSVYTRLENMEYRLTQLEATRKEKGSNDMLKAILRKFDTD